MMSKTFEMFLFANKILSNPAQCYVEKAGRWSDITCIVRQMKHLFSPTFLPSWNIGIGWRASYTQLKVSELLGRGI